VPIISVCILTTTGLFQQIFM